MTTLHLIGGRGGRSRPRRWSGGSRLAARVVLAFLTLATVFAPAVHAQFVFRDAGFTAETVVTLGAFKPVGVTWTPDGRMLVWQRDGVVRVVKGGGLLAAPFVDIRGQVNQYQDRGLLGLAVDPQFATNGAVYLLYTVEAGGNSNDPGPKTARLSRVVVDPGNPDVALAGSEEVILDNLPSQGWSHTVGTVRFLADETLVFSIGDGASFNFVDPLAWRAQDLSSYAGKVIRVNRDGSAPADNPYYEAGAPDSVRSRVWAYGLRNPYRFGLHPATGEVYVGDVGWHTWEEFNRVSPPGRNFGWPCYEGVGAQPEYQALLGGQCQGLGELTAPLYTYDRAQGSAAIGGVIYGGARYPEGYYGTWFVGDYTARTIRRIGLNGAGNFQSIVGFATGVEGPVALEEGPDGLVYVVEFNTGRVVRIGYGGPVARITATPGAGYAPLAVTFSSGGSSSPSGQLTYAWVFGDGGTSTAANPVHVYGGAGVATYTVRLTVTDPVSGVRAEATEVVTVGSTAPAATIETPADGVGVYVGDVVGFTGVGTDADEVLGPGALTWTVLLHHDSHVHPLIMATGSGGSFGVTHHGAGTFGYEIVLTARDSTGLTDTTSVFLPFNERRPPMATETAAIGPGAVTVSPAGPDRKDGAPVSLATVSARLSFTYATRAALLADGWDFIARTRSGGTRNTEQTGALAIDYGQAAHPGRIRIPLGVGELWQTLNSSQNTLFRDLPSDWTSVRLKIAAFNPTADYQQVALIAYQDDDTYVNVQRNFSSTAGGPVVGFFKEAAGVTTRTDRRPLANTANLILRLDRDLPTSTYAAAYSVNDGVTWISLTGTPTQVLTNPRLAVQVGANHSPTARTADLEWVEIIQAGPAPPPSVTAVTPSSGSRGQTLTVAISGSNFVAGATCSFGADITVNACVTTSTQATASVTIDVNATLGPRTVIVTNPDGQGSSLGDAFMVTLPLPPELLGATPNAGGQGQTLTVTLTGQNFLTGAACDFGASITVTTCTVAQATRATAGVTIAADAPLGPRTVTVTNPDGQAATLAAAFSVTPPPPPPVVTGVSPTSAGQAQTSTIVVTGANFLPGAICSFGAGITVGTCVVMSSAQISATITVAGSATVGVRTVTVMNPDGLSGSLADVFSVTPPVPGTSHRDFTFGGRAALLANGWDFLARTASGGTRNTEETGALAINYDQVAHPGRIRVPLGVGELWEGFNNSQNTLFRDLPPDWTSIRLKIRAFNPTANFQQVGLIAYQDDDTYVSVQRNFNSSACGPVIGFFTEAARRTARTDRRPLANTGNLIVRLDRHVSTNVFTAYYSVNSGASWTQLAGSPSQTLANPRLAIQVGADYAAMVPSAELEWVEIVTPGVPPAPALISVSPGSGRRGESLVIQLTGSNFASDATCGFGAQITVTSCVVSNATLISATITIPLTASLGARTVTVTNPDGQSASLESGFAVEPAPAPTLAGVSPGTGGQGESLTVVVTGSNMLSGATCDFGGDVIVSTCTIASSTVLTASLSIPADAAISPRTLVLTNPDGQSASLAGGFSVTAAPGGPTENLTAAALVNAANSTGYNPAPGTPGEFQRYAKLYLDHLQVPYEVIDTATTPPPADLGARQLIVAAHRGLGLSAAWQAAIASAVSGGTGFVNLDDDPAIGQQSHIQTVFGASGSALGSPATGITVPAAVIPGGATPHFITALQRRFLGDPPGDLVFAFHPDSANVVQSVTPTVLQGSTGTVLARVGASALILANGGSGGRAVHFGTLDYLKADRFGFAQGVDDLFWRSLVWAARKPFVLRGYPRFWAVQMDDTMPGWAARVRDLYDPALTGPVNPNGAGGPWKVTGYVFTNHLPPGSGERAAVVADINAGKLRITPHAFDNVKYGDMYWNATAGQLTDNKWLANLAAIVAWRTGNGGADTIPAFSRSFVAHYWDLSDNTGEDLWTTLGVRYITSIQKPGFRFPDQLNNATVYTGDGSERLHAHDFWPHELPPKRHPQEDHPLFFADDYVVRSRAGLPDRTFFLFATQYIDFARYPRNDFIWPSAMHGQNVVASVDQLERYTWLHWSGLSPVQVFTHDVINYQLASLTDRRVVINQSSAWLEMHGGRHIFMDDLGNYLYARSKSRLVAAQLLSNTVHLTFIGASATADGSPVSTEVLVFYPDTEGAPVTVAPFSGLTTLGVALPSPPPAVASIAPGSGLSTGGTDVTITGTNLVGVSAVLFGDSPAVFVSQSETSIVATTPPGSGTVDVSVHAASGTATVSGGFTYTAPPPDARRIEFTYPDRASLLGDGWSFVARTAFGAPRNTEQTGALAINYDQGAHPSRIRIPLGPGELWQTANNSQNMLFQELPADWTSIRLKIASFNPTRDFQQVGLIAYQNDDTYVNVQRNFNSASGGPVVGFFTEVGGIATRTDRRPLANSGNLILRLDRDPALNVFTAFYSVDDGLSWVPLTGTPTMALGNARLAIQVGANASGLAASADLAWAEILR